MLFIEIDSYDDEIDMRIDMIDDRCEIDFSHFAYDDDDNDVFANAYDVDDDAS